MTFLISVALWIIFSLLAGAVLMLRVNAPWRVAARARKGRRLQGTTMKTASQPLLEK